MLERAPILKPFAAVVFDMDGTLLDTEAVFKQAARGAARMQGFELTESLHQSMVGSSHETSANLLTAAFGSTFSTDVFDAECRAQMRASVAKHGVPVKSGVREIIGALAMRGVPMAVATSSRREQVVHHLQGAGLFDHFKAVVTRNDVTNPKPDPEPYLTAARLLGMAPNACLAVEDSHAGVRSAAAAGLQTVLVPDLVAPNAEIAALCAAILPDLGALHTMLWR